MVLGLTFVLRWAATGDARVARDDGCESVERRGGWRRRCSHGAGPGTVMRGREVGRREVEGSAVRPAVGMPCGFPGEVERCDVRRNRCSVIQPKCQLLVSYWVENNNSNANN